METLVTVRGPVPADRFGPALPHEHVLCDFIGADRTGTHRWDRDAVAAVMLPLLREAHAAGIRGFVDCSPAYIARDPFLLRRLSRESDLHILTNTGYYKEPFLPPHAFTESAEELAARWVREAQEGIDGTDVRPGFIKIAVNPGKLLPVQEKIVRAAALAQRETGLTIACHTGHGPAAVETMNLLEEENAPLDRFIVVHSDAIEERDYHLKIWDRGAWVEYDAVGWKPVAWHAELVTWFLARRGADRLLLSHDGGWYWAGEPNGGEQKPFTPLVRELLPELRRRGVSEAALRQVTVENPARAFAVRPASAPLC
jgi:predicted metal-dependent phosphotriesterase family hydrolase